MCNPVALAVGAVGAGTLMQSLGQRRQQSAAADAAKAELGRQRGYADQSNQQFQKSLGEYSNPMQAEAGRTQAIQSFMAGRPATDVMPVTLASTPDAIKAQQTRGIVASGQDGLADVYRGAALKGFGDTQFDRRVATGQNALRQGMIGMRSAGSQNVGNMEVQSALQTPNFMTTWGPILQAGGFAGGMYGAYGRPGIAGPGVRYGATGQGKIIRGPGGMLGGGV